MASDPSPDLLLAPINGKPRPVAAYLTIFHLLFVALDPFSERSAWLVETSGRILTTYDQANCRVAFLVGGTTDEARAFLGHWATDILTFADPELTAIRGFGLQALPAIVHLGTDSTIVNAVEGWDPPAWRALSDRLSQIVDWRGPVIPGPRDPAPFDGEAPTAA